VAESSPLVGREHALDDLGARLRSLSGGFGGCVVVEGQAGIGKSSVIAAAVEPAGALGVAVVGARATEFDRGAPLTTLLDALLRGGVLEAAEAAYLAEGHARRIALVGRLGEAIERSALHRPLVITLDDAHWVDELTALVVRSLVPALRHVSVLWLFARRPLPASSAGQKALDALVDDGAAVLPLGPLPADAIAGLCSVVLGAPPDDGLLSLAARAGGNPFLVRELLRTLRAEGRLAVQGGAVTVTGLGLPLGFRDALARRLRGLPDDAVSLLEVAAVLGRPFTVHEVAGVAGRPVPEVVALVGQAVRAELLVDEGVEFTFRHDLIREAVYDGLAGPVRQALHRQAVGVLRAEGRPAVELVCHLLRSGRDGDGVAAGLLAEAAVEISAGAPSAAADLLLRRLELLPDGHPDRPATVAEATRLLAVAGRLGEAREQGEAVLGAGITSAAGSAILLALAEAAKHAGHERDVEAYTRRGLDRPAVPPAVRAQLLSVRAHGLLAANDVEQAAKVAAEAVEAGNAAGEHTATVFALSALSATARARGDLDDALAAAEDAVELARRAGGAARHRHPGLWLAPALVATERFPEAAAVYDAGERESAELGTGWAAPLWHHYRAELWTASGRLEDAAAEAEAGVRVAGQLGTMALSVPLLALLARIAARRSEPAAAERHLRSAGRLIDDGTGTRTLGLSWAQSWLVPDAREAVRLLTPVYDGLPDRLLPLVTEPSAGPRLVRIAMAAGEPGLAARAVASAVLLAERNPRVPSLVAAAAQARGLADGDLDGLRRAVVLWRAGSRPLDGAAAVEDTARAAQAAGLRAEAVDGFDAALSTYRRCGALRDAQRVRARLRALGVTRARPGAAGRTGWASLTHSEVRVARLVADGMTNREVAAELVLSPHTVDSHLRHAFAKLGISSRVELVRHVLRADR
jgi:DNA-binding CsgD family transcriptional regulator/tetratricopeptide (TPR) repeat protein